MERIYFDYAATTPLDPGVERAMRPYWSGKFGNPSSLHSFGQEALAAVDGARERIAGLLGAGFREIIFTASATEANNLALRGAVGFFRRLSGKAGRASDPAAKVAMRHRSDAETGRRDSENLRLRAGEKYRPRVIVSSVEHDSILETARDLEKDGVEVVYLSVDGVGRVRLDKLKQALNERTVLVSVMYANNELGTIQPISGVAKIINDFKRHRKNNGKESNHSPLFHTDAVQAFQYLDCNVNLLGVDLMTLSGHKIYGPKGIGVLYVRKIGDVLNMRYKRAYASDGINRTIRTLEPLITGGRQEFGLRSGTENVPLIAGMAEAMEIVAKTREKEAKRIAGLRDYFLRGLKKICPKAKLNNSGGGAFLPNILNIFFPDYPADEFLSRLDMLGVAVGTGSACASRAPEAASHVLRALGFTETRAKRSIRISFGRPATEAQVDMFWKCVRKLTDYEI